MHDEWERMKISSAYKKLSSSKDGISDEESRKRILRHGKNEIKKIKKASALKILLAQFTSPLILILIVAAIVSFGIGILPDSEPKTIDSLLILIIVLAVGISGFFQDWKAEKAIEALRKMSAPTAVVLRDGNESTIPATEIVPGDVVLLEGGDVIPADGKIIKSFNMTLDESILTGESKDVRKGTGSTVRMNTSITSGRGKILVFATGMNTEVGKLAEKMGEIEETKTPFQKELERFSKNIFWLVILIAALIMFAGYFRYGAYNAFLTSISIAVAAIPEGLPAVVTLALALGAKSMVSNNALVRKLPVVESIGSINVICTDKTGTLTKNRMSVTKAFFDDAVYDDDEMNEEDVKNLEQLMLCGSLCSNTKTTVDENGKKNTTGDQTEVAITEFALKHDFAHEDKKEMYKRVNEVSFNSKRKMMSVVCKHGSKNYVFSKGAPEVLLNHCTGIMRGGRIVKLRKKTKDEILRQNDEFASHALRVLAFAFKESKSGIKEDNIERDLVFIGLEGMLDPPREEVRNALEECKTAGIRVVMLTGDNIETAKSIATDIGLKSKSALSGSELEKIDDEQLRKMLADGANIFARVTPFDKLRVLNILQKDNKVAMTGDGVNDALALKKADVGIAMGERGTEVAKEASDIILIDDNFASIKNAVREGRRIFDNIRKFANYLLSCNLAEVFVIFMGTIVISLNEPILLPIHILWINLLTDGMPALALGLDPALPNIMKKKPRGMKEGILDKGTMHTVIVMGLNMGVLLIAVFLLNMSLGIGTARTALFMGFVLYEFMRIAAIRHNEELGFFENRLLLIALAASMVLQMIVVYTPLNAYFLLVPLGLYEWTVLITIGVVGWFTSIFFSRIMNRTAT